MRRSSSLFWAQLVSGVVAAAAVAGCKDKGLQASFGEIAVTAGVQDAGLATSFDIGQACAGFATTSTLYLVTTSPNSYNDVTISTPDNPFFTVGQPDPTSVESGAFVPFTVTFNPPASSKPAPQTATFTIASSDANNSPFKVQVTATVASAPSNAIFEADCLTTNPNAPEQKCTSLTFSDDTPVNGHFSQTIDVKNIGCPPLDISAMFQDGGDTEFSFSGLTSPLLYQKSVPVTVTFSPADTFGKSQQLTFTSAYPDAGLPYTVGLSGAGIQPRLTWNPPSWNFPGAAPGTLTCEIFTLTNTGSQAITAHPPIIKPTGTPFYLDGGGWADGAQFLSGQGRDCAVCVDFSDAGITYTAELEATYTQGTTSAPVDAALSANSTSSLCTSTALVNLPDDNIFCGFETGSFTVFTCTDGGSCVHISSIGWADGGNPQNLATITSVVPDGGPTWTVCPGDQPLTVDVSFHDNGLVRNVTDTVEIDSDATGQAKKTVLVVPVSHPVPREAGTPILTPTDGGDFTNGITVGFTAYYVLEGNDANANNFHYEYYYMPLDDAGFTHSWVDAGATDDEVYFTPQDQFVTPGYVVCVIQLEVDAGFGNCGLDSGVPGKPNPLCSAPLKATF